MLKARRFPLKNMLRWGAVSSGIGMVWACIVFILYDFVGFTFLRVPFLPIASVGTAVAFYVGFKNNSAYDRFWEGRKIWGGVVNYSRTWANFVLSNIKNEDGTLEVDSKHRELVYRHLAWINAVRLQLRRTSRFFDRPHPVTKKRLEDHADHMRNDWNKELAPFLEPDELAEVSKHANSATHLLLTQGRQLRALQDAKRVDLFHQIQLMGVIEELYNLQGKAERIKATPFPRQYAEYSRWFTRVFAVLLPFGMLDVFSGSHVAAQMGEVANFGATPPGHLLEHLLNMLQMAVSSGLVTWVFVTMEAIGDSSEDPFERSMNDVPMNALCVVIERDLRQMLGETDVREPEEPIDGILY